ncbi:MAG: hypothetical protein ABL921_21355 [Pirellula sp.]
MTADGTWEAAGECCFVRHYTYNSTQPRQVVSAELQRVTYHRVTTQILKRYPNTGGCPTLFDCVQGDVDTEVVWCERLGLIYQHQSVDVFVQHAIVDCGAGPVPKYIVSVRRNVGFRESIWSASYINEFEEFTSLGCCTGAEAYNVDDMDNEPDWSDVTLWPGYSGSLTDGEYWHHKLYDTLPDDTTEAIDGCLAPCIVPDLCTIECEGICLTSDPTESIPTEDGYLVCPTPDYVARTCTVNNGLGAPCWTMQYFSVVADGVCQPYGRLYGNMSVGIGDASGCGSTLPAMVTTTAFDLDTSCVFNPGTEVCLNDPLSLYFGLPVFIP